MKIILLNTAPETPGKIHFQDCFTKFIKTKQKFLKVSKFNRKKKRLIVHRQQPQMPLKFDKRQKCQEMRFMTDNKTVMDEKVVDMLIAACRAVKLMLGIKRGV